MLTIKSKLKIQDLETLSRILIKPDIINFGLDKVGGGFTEAVAVLTANKLKYKGAVLIINDISLQQTDKLLELDYKLNDIILAFGSWNKDGTVSNDRAVYNIMKAFIEHNIKEKLNTIFLGDIFMGIKHWDSIIANPPYGAIGANIAYKIREELDYAEFVNLLPANDYKRNKTKDLFNYQSGMEAINNGFADAAVTTHLCLINKNKVNNLTLDEFERSQYIDRQLDKYFYELRNRPTVFKDIYLPSRDEVKLYNNTISAIFTKRDVNNKHLPYSKKVNSYRWNVEMSIDADYLINNTAVDFNNSVSVEMIVFNSAVEKTNFINFIYSNQGFKFISKLCTAVNVDSRFALDKLFPKVNWTRPWTVEEILKDYGYTQKEIDEVIADLVNFKGMED